MKFGERLLSMQHVGWEAYYIRYDDLKLLIDNIKACTTDADYKQVSDKFVAELKAMLENVRLT